MRRWWTSRFGVDDRGAAVPVVDFFGWSLPFRRKTVLPRDVERRVYQQFSVNLMRGPQILLFAAAAVVPTGLWAAAVNLVFHFYSVSSRSLWPIMVVPVTYFLGVMVSAQFALRRVNAAFVIRNVVSEGHCGACGYLISNSAPAGDGCVLCPECGAAWKAERWQGPAMVRP